MNILKKIKVFTDGKDHYFAANLEPVEWEWNCPNCEYLHPEYKNIQGEITRCINCEVQVYII